MADILATLPTDNTPASPQEESLIDSLLKMTGESSETGGSRWMTLLKATLILTSIFVVVGSPWVADLVKKIPGFSNAAIALVFQAVVFMVLTGMSLWLLSR